MIWVTWRRYRVLFAVFAVLMIALALWMVELIHSFDVCHDLQAGRLVPCTQGTTSLRAQASVVQLLLHALPCVLGATFGAPLVASELEQSTNRLMWTQGISRTRWFLSKWTVLVLVLLVLVGLMTFETQWWTTHLSNFVLLNAGRMEPFSFPISGAAAVAYTLFALSLGTAAGALFRRTSWAISGTIALYVFALFLMLEIRPNLAPQTFALSVPGSPRSIPHGSWYVGPGYRYAPGSSEASESSESAATVADTCQTYHSQPDSSMGYFPCLASQNVQTGGLYQVPSHYWEIQWKESAILVGLSVVLVAGSIVAIRAWSA